MKSAKIMYAAGFLASSILAFIFYSSGAKIVGRIPGALTKMCDGPCFQGFAVFRIMATLFVLHAVYCLCLIKVRDSDSPRAAIQYGLWPLKVLAFIGLLVGSFFVPNAVFLNSWWAFIVFASFYLIIQALLLVDFAYTAAGRLIAKYEDSGSNSYKYLMIAIIAVFNLINLGATIFYYIHFTDTRSKVFTSLNLIGGCLIQLISILPAVQEANPSSGLLQSGFLAVYCTFLTGSALSVKLPHVGKQSNDFEQVLMWLGLIYTLASLAYGTVAAGNSSDKIALGSAPDPSEHEDEGSAINYSFFHFMFLCASCYMALIISYWFQPYFDADSGYGFQPTEGSVWLKMIISWFVALLYSWTLIAPILFPNRDFGF